MDAAYDSWSEKPLDLVKKKIPVAVVTPSSMVVDSLRKPEVASDTPDGGRRSSFESKEEYTRLERQTEDSRFQNEHINKERGCNKFLPSACNDKRLPTASSMKSVFREPTDYSNHTGPLNLIQLSDDKIKPTGGNVNPQTAKIESDTRFQSDSFGQTGEDVSRLVMQSPNLYSALCKAKDGMLQDFLLRPTAEICRPETPKKESPGMSAAYLEVFDKLMADYMKKVNAQGSLDPLKTDGVYAMMHSLAACEQKLWSALYMGSLLSSSIPIPGLGQVAPLQGPCAPGFTPALHPGFHMGLIPTSAGIPSNFNLDVTGYRQGPFQGQSQSQSPLLSTYPNNPTSEVLRSTSASSPMSVTSTTSSSPSTMGYFPILSSRLGSHEQHSKLKELMQWRSSSDRRSSTPNSSQPSLTTTTDLSSSSVKSTEESMSATSSVRSSSMSSPLNLALSPISSVGASPPLSSKSESLNRSKPKRSVMDHQKSTPGSNSDGTNGQDSASANNNQDKKKPHIKKPLNAFMLYMKEMRAKVVAECTLKESAAINQILGRRWHSLTREEQAKYYEKARHERQLHMQLYPAWSARDNYGYGAKKKKRKKERVPVDTGGGNNMKKCRARYGLEQQSQWCKPCRRKKKCIRYMEAGGGGGGDDGNQSDDNLGSCGSVGDGDAHTPDDDDGDESMSQSHSLSSPGGLSGLSSLTSPSMILPSPSTSLASPSVSLASPCMSLQSPLTPLEYECKPPPPLPLPLPLPMYNHQHSPLLGPPLHRHPVGTNPHDINNPLSVNQLTGKCIKTETNSTASSGSGGAAPGPSAPSNIIRVT